MATSVLDQANSTMLLATIHDVDEVRLDTVPLPQCGPDDIVVAVQQCGICGSDLGYVAMGGLMGPGNPMPIGHELSAVVSETGSNVTSVAVGDRVVVNPMSVDPAIGNMGPEGGFAPYLLVRGAASNDAAVLPLPDNISDELGALVEPLSVAMHGVHQGAAKASDRAVVFGAGTIGLSMAIVLDYYGLKDIVVVDTCEQRLQRAAQIGAKTFVAGSGNLADFLMETHGKAQYFGMDVPATDLYLEATGVGQVFDQIVDLACTNARIVIVGLHKAPVQFNLGTVLSKELSITGAMGYPVEFPEVLDMLGKIDLDPSLLVTHRYPLSDFHNAFAMAKNPQQALKVMIDCQG